MKINCAGAWKTVQASLEILYVAAIEFGIFKMKTMQHYLHSGGPDAR
jgi:hypothetical protein